MSRGDRYSFGESIPMSGCLGSFELDIVYVFICACQLGLKRMVPAHLRVVGVQILEKWALILAGTGEVSLIRTPKLAEAVRRANELLEMVNGSSDSSNSSPSAFVASYWTRELSDGGVFSSLIDGREFRP